MYVESLCRFKNMSLYPISPEAMQRAKRMPWDAAQEAAGTYDISYGLAQYSIAQQNYG